MRKILSVIFVGILMFAAGVYSQSSSSLVTSIKKVGSNIIATFKDGTSAYVISSPGANSRATTAGGFDITNSMRIWYPFPGNGFPLILQRYQRAMGNELSPSTTGDIWRGINELEQIGGGNLSGHLYIYARGAGADFVSYIYTILCTSDSTATFTQITSRVRGTNPLPTVSVVADGGGGAVKVQGGAYAGGTVTVRTAYVGIGDF